MDQATANAIPQLSTATVAAVAISATFGAFEMEKQISHVRNYDPRVPEIAGFRHAVVRYRVTDKKETVSKPAKMVTIPALVLPEEYSLLDERAQKVIRGIFEDEQDNIIRNLIDEKQASYIGWDLVTLDPVLTSLTAVRMSQRLTKEQIEQWARIALVAPCEQRAKQIAEAKGFNAEDTKKQIAGVLNAYVTLATRLAAPVPNLGQNEANAINNLLTVAQLGDDMAKVLLAKLDAILHPKVLENEYL